MPSRWQTAIYLKEQYRVDLAVFAPPIGKISSVYDASGYLTPSSVGLEKIPDFVHLVPLRDVERPTRGFESRELKQRILDYDPDIVWIHGEPLQRVTRDLCRWFLFRGGAKIYQAAIENCQPTRKILRHVIGWLLLTRVEAFLAAAEPTAQALTSGLRQQKGKIHVTYLPNIPPKVQKSSYRSRIKNQVFAIGFAGRLVERKGIYVLLEALGVLPPEVRLYVAGDGDNAIIEKIRTDPRITYLGLLGDLSELLERIDILVVPSLTTASWKEQFGRVIAEAYSCGIPVVGSDSGSIPDVVGDGGLIYDELSPVELAARIRTVFEDESLHRALSANALSRFENHFSVSAHGRRLAALFGLQAREKDQGP